MYRKAGVQKVYNICDKWFAVIGLNTDIQKSGGVLFRNCTIFVMNDWLFIGLDLDVWGKWGCSVQSNLCFMPSWKCTIFVTMTCCYWLGHWCTEKGGVLFRKCTICVMNDLLSLAWTLVCSKVGVFYSESVQYEWVTVIGLDTDVQKTGAVCISGSGIWLADYNGLTDNTNLVPFIPFGDLDQYSPLFQGFIVFWTYIIIFQVRELGLLWWAEYVQYICCTHLYGSCECFVFWFILCWWCASIKTVKCHFMHYHVCPSSSVPAHSHFVPIPTPGSRGQGDWYASG